VLSVHACNDPAMHIRPLTTHDASLYVALRREMLADAPGAFGASLEDDTRLDAERVGQSIREGAIAGGYAIIGAFEQALAGHAAALVGCAVLIRETKVKTRHRADIFSVYVTPAARGRGVALAMIASCKDLARTWQGVNSLRLSVSVRASAAQRVYERAGFVAWGVEPACLFLSGEFIDEVHMVCML
jgi:RimJ/RimL family protein N-acetyltransferase